MGAMTRKLILVAVDDSDIADLISKEAAKLSLDFNAKVILFTILPRPAFIGPDSAVHEIYLEKEEHKLHELHSKLIETHFSAIAGITIESKVLYGDPATEIMKFADEINADLIVMGSRGKGKVSKFLLGSLSEKVRRESRHSVFVVNRS